MRTIITIIALGWLAQSLWSDEDPLTSSQPTITQRMLIEKAMGNSYLILARKAEIESASSRRAHSRARELPSLSARLAAQITSDPVRVRPIRFNAEPGVFSEEVWTASLGISTPLYSGGRLQAETAAFNWLEKAAKLDLLTAQQTLATRIVTLFQETKAAEAYLSSLQDSRDTLNAQHARIQALIAGEKAAEVDLLRVSVRLASLEQKITEIANSKEVLIATLEMLSGDTIPPDANFEESFFPNAESDIDKGFASHTALLRADEQSSLARLESAKEQIRATKALKRPSVELSAAYGPRSDFGGDA
ncbi:MAG TPA: TolC family protein, partial [Opitutales bacterium]|nr:TolC family protein [Opitutales bacterium]